MKTNDSFRQGMGFAARLGIEFTVATGVGTLMGYFLDDWLETSPWFLALGVIFGGAAGCLNVYRAAKELTPPKDEDDSVEPESREKSDDLKL